MVIVFIYDFLLQPCFEPTSLRGFQRNKTEEKKTLLTSMENGEDLY